MRRTTLSSKSVASSSRPGASSCGSHEDGRRRCLGWRGWTIRHPRGPRDLFRSSFICSVVLVLCSYCASTTLAEAHNQRGVRTRSSYITRVRVQYNLLLYFLRSSTLLPLLFDKQSSEPERATSTLLYSYAWISTDCSPVVLSMSCTSYSYSLVWLRTT